MYSFARCAAVFLGGVVATVATTANASAAGCQLGNGIKHVVYLQFDNVHLKRDNPNVPSDLEQMPALLNFLQGNGALSTNHHTPLISHTSVDIVSSLTGVYGEKFGFAVGNSFGFFDPTGTPHFQSAFSYWTDTVNEGTATNPILVPQHVDQRGLIHPAPWAPWTRAGCDVGTFSIANLELENTTSDVDTVFGATSPEHNENSSNPTLAHADFEGIAIHCAQNSLVCARSPKPVADLLPNEPGGYNGFQALFGNKYVAPAINNGNGYVLDLDGNHVQDGFGNDGFPNSFSPAPTQALGYVAQMLEAGVPVIYFYIEDAHDNHVSSAQFSNCPTSPDGTFGPGEATYVCQLQAYQAAFSKFFARLTADGITPANTLFVMTSDENDHFAGNVANALPAGCDGINTPCTYPVGSKGEAQADLSSVFNTEFGNTTPFVVHSDDAPTFHINGNPSQTSGITRTLEQQAANLVGFDPSINGDAPITQALADQAEMAFLHMISHDPARTPNFVLFGNPDFFLSASGRTTPLCTPASDSRSCVTQPRTFAWNHGDFQPEIVTTWLGMVGPGVNSVGTTALFNDHTDIRPTMLALAGLTDDYTHDGRVFFEVLNSTALPQAVRDHLPTLTQLAQAYEAINAPTGPLGIKTLTGLSTKAVGSTDPNTYAALESNIQNLTFWRNQIAGQMIAMLEGAEFNGLEINESAAQQLIIEANGLLALPNSHDFNADFKSDVLFRDLAGNAGLWLMNGPQIGQSFVFGTVPTVWSVVGQRDFNGDGSADVLWRDSSGNLGMWLMNGTQIQQATVLGNVPTTWSVAGTGDFNGDGKADIIWRDTSGSVGIWLMNGAQILQSSVLGNVPTSWVIAGSDMKGNIFWRNTTTSEVGMWVMNGTSVKTALDFGPVSGWNIAGIGDFDGNGSNDLLWTNSSGGVAMWLMNGTQIMSAPILGNVATNWQITQTGDYNGDGRTDIVWVDATGNIAIWLMSGSAISSSTTLGTIGAGWNVQAINAD